MGSNAKIPKVPKDDWVRLNRVLRQLAFAVYGSDSVPDFAGVSLNYVDFDTSYEDGTQEGRLQWNTEDGTLEVGMPGGNVNGQILQEMLFRTFNDEGAVIDNGRPVLVNGATGNRLTVRYPDMTDAEDSFAVIALATENLSVAQGGYVSTAGYVRGDTAQPIDTSVGAGFSEGGQVFVGDDGDISPTPATKPNRTVFVGIVKRAHATEGEIWVNVIHLPMLYELSDVSIIGLANNHVLQYDAPSSLWKNTKTVNGITLTNIIVSGSWSWIGDGAALNLNGGSKIIQIGDALTFTLAPPLPASPWLKLDTAGGKIDFGNASDNPSYNFLGSGLTTLGGDLRVDGGDIGLTVDPDLIQLASTSLTFNATIDAYSPGNRHTMKKVGASDALPANICDMTRDAGSNSQEGDGVGIRFRMEDDTNGTKNAGRMGAFKEAGANDYSFVFESSNNGTLTKVLTLTSDKDAIFEGDTYWNSEDSGLLFAQIYEEDGTGTLTLAAQDTVYQIASFSANGESNGATPDYTNDHITVSKAGKYLVQFSVSFSQTTAVAIEYDFHVAINNGGTTFDEIGAHRNSGGVSAVGNCGSMGIIDLAANDTVELWVERLDGAAVSRTITFQALSLTLYQIGGT